MDILEIDRIVDLSQQMVFRYDLIRIEHFDCVALFFFPFLRLHHLMLLCQNMPTCGVLTGWSLPARGEALYASARVSAAAIMAGGQHLMSALYRRLGNEYNAIREINTSFDGDGNRGTFYREAAPRAGSNNRATE